MIDQQNTTPSAISSGIDAGLQAYMRYIYNTMSLGLIVTGFVAFVVANVPALRDVFILGPLRMITILSPLAFIFFGFTPKRIAPWPASKVRTMFFIFSGVMGLSMAAIFLVYAGESIARAFFITAGAFAGTSLYGYVTKKDLSGVGSFMFMGLIGIIIAGLINIFMHNAMMGFVISTISVIVFTGLTAWDTQRLKEVYAYSHGSEDDNKKVAVMGALSLYLNFINLFQAILNLTGQRD